MTTACTQLEVANFVPTSEPQSSAKNPSLKAWLGSAVALGLLAGGVATGPYLFAPSTAPAAALPAPSVAVSTPLRQSVATTIKFLGQFSPVERVDLNAQVGGILTQIGFKDGDIVHKGDLLFEIDPTPYQIRVSQAQAALENARAEFDLASRQLARAIPLAETGSGTVQTVDQRTEERNRAQASMDAAEAAIRDAKFDLDHTRVTAPFTGRIGSHLVSAGNLISGSRAGSGPTTRLATLVSLDTIYLNFDMSEADYLKFARERQNQAGPLADKVGVSLSDETTFKRQGVLDFVDNVLDRSSGTIHARATVANADHFLTPGGFARVKVDVSSPAPALLIPDAAVLPDQSEHMVYVVGQNDVAIVKHVELGGLEGGLRIIKSGLTPSDRVIIDGLTSVVVGSKVASRISSIHADLQDAQS